MVVLPLGQRFLKASEVLLSVYLTLTKFSFETDRQTDWLLKSRLGDLSISELWRVNVAKCRKLKIYQFVFYIKIQNLFYLEEIWPVCGRRKSGDASQQLHNGNW